MKRVGNLWEKFITKENFYLAWKELSVEDRKTIKLQFVLEDDEDGKILICFTTSSTIRKQLEKIKTEDFPVRIKIRKQGEVFYLE